MIVNGVYFNGINNKDLHLINCRNIILPSNLHVIGNLTIEKCNNITFNKNIQIDKDFIFKRLRTY